MKLWIRIQNCAAISMAQFFFEIFKKHSFGTIWDQSGVTADTVTANTKRSKSCYYTFIFGKFNKILPWDCRLKHGKGFQFFWIFFMVTSSHNPGDKNVTAVTLLRPWQNRYGRDKKCYCRSPQKVCKSYISKIYGNFWMKLGGDTYWVHIMPFLSFFVPNSPPKILY